LEIHYHPGKANVVADALSRKSYVNMAVAFQMPQELCEEFEQLILGFLHHTSSAAFKAERTLEAEIRQHQKEDKCGRTNLNYTDSSTRVLTEGLPRTSNGIKPLVCRVTSR
jgi:hypothetical protein